MIFLHTSDWHLGRTLYGRKRYDEFQAFLDWLVLEIDSQNIDALLVAGDVFDNSTPSNLAQKLYYKFLFKVSSTCCRHVVIVAGNHDSPSFLDAPKVLLETLNVHVVGAMTEQPEDEVIILKDACDQPEAICLAVPYLRDRDIRTVEAGESLDDKNIKLVEGIRDHYQQVAEIASRLKQDYSAAGCRDLPIVATGHLFAAGGQIIEGDGVRDLYVGSLAHIRADVFPPAIDYLALGHLHVPQVVGGLPHIRYSGSPLAMGFGEAGQNKQIIKVELTAKSLRTSTIPVPVFQPLARISGDLDAILSGLEQLKLEQSRAWLEIEYTGHEVIPDLRDRLDEVILDSQMEIGRVRNRQVFDRVIHAIQDEETLDDLTPLEVFNRCMDESEVAETDREGLAAAYREIIQDIRDEDPNSD